MNKKMYLVPAVEVSEMLLVSNILAGSDTVKYDPDKPAETDGEGYNKEAKAADWE